MSESISSRVDCLVLNIPLTAEVTVLDPGFLIPRILRQRCSASMITMAPFGFSRGLFRIPLMNKCVFFFEFIQSPNSLPYYGLFLKKE